MSKRAKSPLAAEEERRLFRSMIRGANDNPKYCASVLADSHHECSYPEIVGYIEQIQAYLKACGVDSRDCITLELSKSVRGALAALALLDKGFSFISIPVTGQGARRGSASREPSHARFSRWVVSVRTGKPSGPLAECPPDSYLHVTPNPDFEPSARKPDPNSPRLYWRTSGSLDAPKLVVHRYAGWHDNALLALRARGFTESHRIALPVPIFHNFSFGSALLPALAGGASVDLQEQSNLLTFFEREREFEPNVAYVTPAFCETLIRTRRSPRQYDFMVISGDRVSQALFKRSEELHGPVITQYGSTETGIISANALDMPYELRSSTVGRPVEGVEIRIVPLPGAQSEDTGELQIRHPCAYEGYVDLDGALIC